MLISLFLIQLEHIIQGLFHTHRDVASVSDHLQEISISNPFGFLPFFNAKDKDASDTVSQSLGTKWSIGTS